MDDDERMMDDDGLIDDYVYVMLLFMYQSHDTCSQYYLSPFIMMMIG